MAPTTNKPQSVSSSGVLDIDTVAAQLATTPLSVKRLIARGQLKATVLKQTGGNKTWRVLASSVERYLTAGAPDFTMPGLNPHGWLTDEHTYTARRFEGSKALIEAFQEQQLDDDDAKASFGKFETSIDRAIRLTPEVREALSQKFPNQPDYGEKGYEEFPYLNWAEAYLVEAARAVALKLCSHPVRLNVSPLERLYESPEDYQRITTETLAGLKKRKIVAKQLLRYGPLEPHKTVFYILGLGIILEQTTSERRVIDLAF
jgi:hypothetical protein